MASNIIVSGAGTAAANGTFTPNDANLAAPAKNIPLFAMASGVNFFLVGPSSSNWNWTIGASGASTAYYQAPNGYATAAAAIAAGPQASTYSTASTYSSVSGVAPVPTITQQGAAPGPESAPSNTASATPQVPVPNAPTSLTAAFVFANVGGNPNAPSVNLAWVAPASGQAPTSYSVFRGTTVGGESATPIVSGITGLTYQDTTVANATTYFYFVEAFDAGGASVASNEISVKTATLASTGLSVVAGDGRCVLSWTGASGALSYNVKRSASALGSFTTIANVTTPSYTDAGLSNGTGYFYFVTSLD